MVGGDQLEEENVAISILPGRHVPCRNCREGSVTPPSDGKAQSIFTKGVRNVVSLSQWLFGALTMAKEITLKLQGSDALRVQVSRGVGSPADSPVDS